MNKKTDDRFIEACLDSGKGSPLLKSLIWARRCQGIMFLLLSSAVIVVSALQLFSKGDLNLHGGFIIAYTVNLFLLVHADLTIKMILLEQSRSQRESEPVKDTQLGYHTEP